MVANDSGGGIIPPKTTLPNQNGLEPAYNGSGEYDPFPASSGGPAGGGYVPPVPPNPTFVPPIYTPTGTIKVHLISNEPAQFTENDTNVGTGLSITLEKTSISFNSQYTYKSVINGKRTSNYYIVSIEKEYNDANTITGTSSTGTKDSLNLNYNIKPDTSNNDYLFSEIISIKEYRLDVETGEYNFSSERKLTPNSSLIDLTFTYAEGVINTSTPTNEISTFSIGFKSNYSIELGDNVVLSYQILDSYQNVVLSDDISLGVGESDSINIEPSVIQNSTINFKIGGSLPAQYKFNSSYYINPARYSTLTSPGFTGWTRVGQEFSVPGSSIADGILIDVEFDKEEQIVAKPTISLDKVSYDILVKESDKDALYNLTFNAGNADFVDAFLPNFTIIRNPASKGYVQFQFSRDFNSEFGSKKITLIANSNTYGNGDRVEVMLNYKNANDFPQITQIIFPPDAQLPSFSDMNYGWDIIYKSFAASAVSVDLLLKDLSRVPLFTNLTPTGTININLANLINKYPLWNGSDKLTLIFKPYNTASETEEIGNEYEITTNITYPSIKLDEDIIRKTIYDAFIDNLKFTEPEKESKYLTHLLNLGNDEHVLISSWEEDNWTLSDKTQDELGNEVVTNEVKSVILKLYEPLPAEYPVNTTVWVTKLMSNPLVETIVLNEQEEIENPYIKGPNFNVDVSFVQGKSTNYESLDDLIISASSSTTLIQNYLSASLVDTTDLNIQYVSGSVSQSQAVYLWDNFVHFSSAVERVNNFVYKVQLIENYEQLILSASTDYTSGGSAAWTASLSAQQEVQRLNAKKSSLVQGFDGFETFLYTSSSYTTSDSGSMTWPFNSGVRLSSTDINVTNWYDTLIGLATLYDVNNPNWLVNNIPQYIRYNDENDQFLLFFSMIGHHFDNIYYYTKAIERSRGFGYNSKNGVANKLLFDTLKSFNWDAKNLGHDKALWNYVFGEDKAGGSKESTPSNERSKEVWRRIVNNLPYLLKHKGTRRGIYALMACYGIPSSNLSIMEFGGPEVTDDSKNKLLIDGSSYGLHMVSGNSISIGSISNAKTVELFVKPSKAGNYNVVSDGSNNIILSGSINSEYGKVKFGTLETPLLPIFNGRYVGLCVSNIGSGKSKLDVMQVESDRLIFSASVTGSTALGTSFTIGSTFSGSIDEFRIWNTPLSSSVFQQHVYYPEMINGNHISASTTDLELRFDFEYPKNLNTKTKIYNVAPGIKLGITSSRNYYEDAGVTTGMTRLRSTMPFNATAASFTSVTEHPYQFEVINRNIVLEMPDIGVSRYATNKIRLEEQSLTSDLSSKSRSTKKAFDNQPIDSNRVGLFFSPNKELNLDIAKSLGDTNLNEYIGDPSDRYKPGYNALDSVRNYYFQRIQNRDIYAYINLIRAYEKAMFDDIKQMLPARVTATTGILIEPHFLERSKYQYTKPTGSNEYYEGTSEYYSEIVSENQQYESVVNADLGEQVFGENEQYETLIDANLSENLTSENEQFDSTIYANDEIDSSGEFFTYETSANAQLDLPTITTQDINYDYNILASPNDYVDIGFSIYSQNGAAIWTYYENGVVVKERVRVTLVEEQKTLVYQKYNVVIAGKGDPRGGFIETSSFYTEKNIIIQPFSGSVMPMSGSGSIVSSSPVNGYLPTHYKFTTDLTSGMRNSYYNGCKNTSATTLDGTEPVEVFVTNPNTIRVNNTRNNNEPIIEVE